jgi:hypothetical protein
VGRSWWSVCPHLHSALLSCAHTWEAQVHRFRWHDIYLMSL